MATDSNYAARLRLTPKKIEEDREWGARQTQELGFPAEAFDEDALFWTHVMKKREEYESLVASGQNKNDTMLANFFRRVYVDREYITKHLNDKDIAAANAWKITYLKRLRAEAADESYINAYLQAWNLDASHLAGDSVKGPTE